MTSILIVSHCVLNTAAKVKRFESGEAAAEENLRQEVLRRAVEGGVQLLQLPCPEFLQYGARRWGHTYEQFDNPFFRRRCREMLQPLLLQLQEYLANPEEFRVLGVLGIDGSPSCGVGYTCRGQWGGEFSGRDVTGALRTCHLEQGSGVLMEELRAMLEENGIDLPFAGLFAPEPERALALLRSAVEA